MGKYLKLFKTHEEFDEYKNSGNILPKLSHCVREVHIHYSQRKIEIGDYLYSDGNTGKIPKKNVIGVCVDTNEREKRFMSLVNMSVDSITGTTEDIGIRWGVNGNPSCATRTPYINVAPTYMDGKQCTSCLIMDEDNKSAIACSNFSPGYMDGLWFLPACGEILKATRDNYTIVNESISNAINAGAIGAKINLRKFYWCTTERFGDGESRNRYVWSVRGDYIDPQRKSDQLLVRAFLII